MNNKKNYRILLVDDDRFLVDMYSIKFSEAGIKVDLAFNGREAMDKIENGDVYDVLLVDLIMPLMDGYEFLREFRSKNYLPNATVIILSNQGQESDIKMAKEMKIDGYMIKANTIPSEVVSEVLSMINEK